MEFEEIGLILDRQKAFFASGKTLDITSRIKTLKKLRQLIIDYDQEIRAALWQDFHKPTFEVMATETGFVLQELNLTIRKLTCWSRPRKVKTPLVHFISRSYIEPQPYGQVLILSPWNFPFQLTFLPMLGALAAGNCVILKVSRQTPATAAVMEKIISHFPDELVSIIPGNHDVSEYLLSQNFDYIFFTGSCKTGKYVMGKAAEKLIPVSLELGGKNPCVVAADARLSFAAKRIAWGKFINAGQTCIAPDYLLIDRKIKDEFLTLLANEIKAFYGDDPKQSEGFARIINESNTKRLAFLIGESRIYLGGESDTETCYVAPTILDNVTPEDPVMQEEIFGPILPVISYEQFEEVYAIIKRNSKPLATYIFTRDNKLVREFLKRTESGSAAINETVMQIANPHLPYGGLDSSGMGRYHGKKSFETFSNMRSVLVKSNLVDLPLRYPPYTPFKEKIVRWFLNSGI